MGFSLAGRAEGRAGSGSDARIRAARRPRAKTQSTSDACPDDPSDAPYEEVSVASLHRARLRRARLRARTRCRRCTQSLGGGEGGPPAPRRCPAPRGSGALQPASRALAGGWGGRKTHRVQAENARISAQTPCTVNGKAAPLAFPSPRPSFPSKRASCPAPPARSPSGPRFAALAGPPPDGLGVYRSTGRSLRRSNKGASARRSTSAGWRQPPVTAAGWGRAFAGGPTAPRPRSKRRATCGAKAPSA